MESLEIFGPRHSDSRAVVAVAPGDIILVFYLAYARVISVDPLPYLIVFTLENKRLRAYIPLQAVFGKTGMQTHAPVGVIAAEHSGETVPERHYGRVEYAV